MIAIILLFCLALRIQSVISGEQEGIIETIYGYANCSYYMGATFYFDGVCHFEGMEFPMQTMRVSDKGGKVEYISRCSEKKEQEFKCDYLCMNHEYAYNECVKWIDPQHDGVVFSKGKFPDRTDGFVYHYYYQFDKTCSDTSKMVKASILDWRTCLIQGDESVMSGCSKDGQLGELRFSDRNCKDFKSFKPYGEDCSQVCEGLDFYGTVSCEKRI